MANIYDGNNKKYEALHIKRVNAIEAKIKAFFKRATDKASLLASKAGKPGAEPFSFKDHPDLEKQADEIARELAGSVRTTLLDGVRTEWSLANEKNDELARLVFGDQTVQAMTPDIHARYFGKNEDALEAFAARKTAGLNLSDRVWKYTFGFKNEIEMALDLGIREGKSAAEISRDLRGYLQHPDKLFRRVRDEHGILHLSKAAKDYHPGIGVYRSSYMNARRLAVTETNMAYRAADHVRQQQLDFVVGIRIKLSNNHNCKGVPAGMFVDICDTLQGDYPKDFLYTGWHPHCRCHTEPILKTPEELEKDTDRILQGKKPTAASQNRVKDLPDNFLKWMEDNKDKIAAGEKTGKLPYFLRDNHKMLGIKPKTTKAKVVMKEALAFNFEEPAIPAPAPTKPQTIVQEFIKEPSNYPDETKYKKIYDAIEHWKEGQNESPILLELIENSTFDGELARGMTMTQKEYRDFTDALIKKKGNAAKAIFKKGSITSWTKDESIAREFYAPSTGDDSIRIVMKVKGKMKGYDLDKGALWGNEDHEVILSQKIKLKYVSRMQKHDELGDYVEIILKPTDIPEAKTAAIPTKLTPKEIAAKRHAARTSEQTLTIQKAWDLRRIDQLDKAWRDERLPMVEALNEPLNEARMFITSSTYGDKASLTGTRLAIEKAYRRLKNHRQANARHNARTANDIRKIQDLADERRYGKEYVKAMHRLEKELGLKREKRMTYEQADKQKANPNYKKGGGYRINCQTCAPAYMLRLNGFKVTAKENTAGSLLEDLSRGKVLKAWKTKSGKPATYEDLYKWMSDKGYTEMSKDRYLEFWKEKTAHEGVYLITVNYETGGAHATILQRFKDGELKYIEPQHDNYADNKTKKKAANLLEAFASVLARNPKGTRGIIRIDDKFFDALTWGEIFNIK